MQKIPTLFVREYDGPRVARSTESVTPGLEWVLEGRGIATVKIDGSCCAVLDDRFFRRYDAKRGKTPPPSAVPCCPPDPVTGHWPHWLPVTPDDLGANWHLAALYNSGGLRSLTDGTYEAVGPHFQSNPYSLTHDILVRHGSTVIPDCPRSFYGLRDFLAAHDIEGIVFWRDGSPRCKIKRSDFGFPWPSGTPSISPTI